MSKQNKGYYSREQFENVEEEVEVMGPNKITNKNINDNPNTNLNANTDNNDKVEVMGPIEGYVSNCEHLNIREEPTTDSKVLMIVDKDEMLVIEPTESTEEWYKITTESGVKGFCMREYITTK